MKAYTGTGMGGWWRVPSIMRLGLFAINYNTCAHPESCVRVARAAEEAGFDSVWTAEHFVLPSGPAELRRLRSTTPMIDTIAAAAWIAAHTSSIRIGTGILILPLHHPVILANSWRRWMCCRTGG